MHFLHRKYCTEKEQSKEVKKDQVQDQPYSNGSIFERFAVWSLDSASDTIETAGRLSSGAIDMTSSILGEGIKTTTGLTKEALKPLRVNIPMPKVVKSGMKGTSSAAEYTRDTVKDTVGLVSDIGAAVGSAVASGIIGNLPGFSSPAPGTQGSKVVAAAHRLAYTSARSTTGVLGSMEGATSSLMDTASQSTVDLVEHSLGKDFAEVTHDAFRTGRSAFETVDVVRNVSTKKLAEKMVKSAGKSAVRTIGSRKEQTALPKEEEIEAIETGPVKEANESGPVHSAIQSGTNKSS